MTLYELTEREIALLEMLEDPDADREEIQMLLEASQEDLKKKADGYATIHRRMVADVEMIGKEIQRLQKLKKSIEDNDDHLKESLMKALLATGKNKLETSFNTFTVKESTPKLIVDDPQKVPSMYLIKQPDKVNNKALKEFLKTFGDEDCEYAHLEPVKSLVIA